MGIYLAGTEYDEIHVGGNEFSGLLLRGQDYAPETDSPGVLTVNASRQSRGANIAYSVTDADGIRAVTAVIMVASDGTRSDVTSEITRSDANTFAGTSRRMNNKWRAGSITVTYTDATSGASHTVTQDWSV